MALLLATFRLLETIQGASYVSSKNQFDRPPDQQPFFTRLLTPQHKNATKGPLTTKQHETVPYFCVHYLNKFLTLLSLRWPQGIPK